MKKERDAGGAFLDASILILFVIGFFVIPIHIRMHLATGVLGLYAHMNVPCVLAVGLTLLRWKEWR